MEILGIQRIIIMFKIIYSNLSTENHASDDYIPECEKSLKLFVGHKFKSVEDEVVGGYSNVGATGDDFKNFSRDLRAYISGCDAQIDDNLISIFWSDPTTRRNYSIFGDVVSFDCTYKINRYKMIFAPFTGKDNHGKTVTFGAALLSAENYESYEWVFEKFKECMRRHPSMIITDQDPAMRIAVQRIFPDARHRLCMWHIMLKVPKRLPAHLKKDESLRKSLNALVWSDLIEPDLFDAKWDDIIAEYGLADESWFRSMFAIRDHPMSGICRTTSISESMNSFFNNYLNYGANLVEFMMHFDSAMDALYTPRRSAVEGDIDKMHILLRGMKELKDVLVSGDAQSLSASLTKSKLFELFYGCACPDEVVVNPPILVKTKGSRSRIPSRVEKEIRVSNKPFRMCSNCGEKTRHDARNCPLPKWS
ncbi:hypothetical protein C2S52_013915 [Perilla frutescens var. hirtella]|nr:hypothetical protein C2S52_013915 [Perilla frutescens var. hirtella]